MCLLNKVRETEKAKRHVVLQTGATYQEDTFALLNK